MTTRVGTETARRMPQSDQHNTTHVDVEGSARGCSVSSTPPSPRRASRVAASTACVCVSVCVALPPRCHRPTTLHDPSRARR